MSFVVSSPIRLEINEIRENFNSKLKHYFYLSVCFPNKNLYTLSMIERDCKPKQEAEEMAIG